MNVLDLFSGIGGFSLGLERAGMRTVAFCEIEPYCRAVLAKHWPGVPVHGDIRELYGFDVGAVDVICGGFPCQDISLAGRGAGLDGEKSGLWSEYRRLVAELKPIFVVIENSPALRTRGGDRVISDLEALDYTCEAFVVGALHVGAPHRRQRAWLIAYANGPILRNEPWRRCRASGSGSAIARDDGAAIAVADAHGQGKLQQEGLVSALRRRAGDRGQHLADADSSGLEILLDGHAGQFAPSLGAHPWAVEPDVGRVAYGVPSRVDRIKALGNSVVPQITEAIGRSIMSAWQQHIPHVREAEQ